MIPLLNLLSLALMICPTIIKTVQLLDNLLLAIHILILSTNYAYSVILLIQPYGIVTNQQLKKRFLKIIETSYLEYSEAKPLDCHHHHLPQILKTLI